MGDTDKQYCRELEEAMRIGKDHGITEFDIWSGKAFGNGTT